MKKLITLALVYLAGWGVVGFLWFDWTNVAAERGRHAIALGEQHAAQLAPPEKLEELARACKGKLEPGSYLSIAGYVAKSLVTPTEEGAWDEVLVGVEETLTEDIARQRRERFVQVLPEDAFWSTVNPFKWQVRLSHAKQGSPQLAGARYLVVAKYFSIVPPTNEGLDGYTRGAGAYSARVIGFRDGEVLCEGRGEVRMKETVNAAGRGETKEAAEAAALTNAAKMVPFVFSLSVTTSPLHALCDVGGEELCRLTSRWVGK